MATGVRTRNTASPGKEGGGVKGDERREGMGRGG